MRRVRPVYSAYLRKTAHECEERESVRAVGEWERRKDRELGTNPNETKTDRDGNLASDVHCARALLIQERQHPEADSNENPTHVVLRAIAVDDLY